MTAVERCGIIEREIKVLVFDPVRHDRRHAEGAARAFPGPKRNLGLRLSQSLKPENWPMPGTLGDAAHYISELDDVQRTHPAWQCALDLIEGAAATGNENDIAEATRATKTTLE